MTKTDAQKTLISIPNVKLGTLIVTDFRPYFDVSGSYLDHLEATVNRSPTHGEMEILYARKIVCVSHTMGQTGEWDGMHSPNGNWNTGENGKRSNGGKIPQEPTSPISYMVWGYIAFAVLIFLAVWLLR